MKTKTPTPIAGKVPKYAHIVDAIQQDIAAGRLMPNDRLPSFVEMVERFGVAKQTVDKAHAILEQDGLIRREQGRGVFVEPPRKKASTGFIGYLDVYRNYTSHSAYFRQIQDGVRLGASEAGKHMVIIDSVQTFNRWDDLDGLLLCEVGASNRAGLQTLLPEGLPVVNLLFNDPQYPSVQAADETGIRMLVEHLWELGHRRIAHLSRSTDSQLQLRHQAYREALLRRGIEPQDEWSFRTDGLGEAYSHYGYYMMQDWLENGWEQTGCTAILAQNDLMAFGVVKALQENGINVPGDISVVGFDGVEHVGNDGLNEPFIVPVELTTIRIPLFEIGATAMRVVLGRAEQIPAPPKSLQLPVELIVGETSAPCRVLAESQEAIGLSR